MSINEQKHQIVRDQGNQMTNKNDRRSQRTRQLLSEAFISLVLDKGYGAVTVNDIIERANIGRSTFYAHYKDKDDLLVSELDRVVDLLAEHIPHDEIDKNSFPSLGLFRHIGEQHELYKALVWSSGADLLFKHEQKSLSEKIEQAFKGSGRKFNVPLPILSNYVAGSFLTLLKWWLENKMVHTPEQMDEIFRKLTLPGIEAAAIE